MLHNIDRCAHHHRHHVTSKHIHALVGQKYYTPSQARNKRDIQPIQTPI